MIRKTMLVGVTLLTIACANQSVHSLKNELNTFLNWLPGSYNNDAQHAADAKRPKEQRHGQLAFSYRRVSSENITALLGSHVIEQKVWRNGDFDKLYRHLLMAYEIDEERNGIVQISWRVKEKGTALKDITMADLTAMPDGCEGLWRRDGDSFVGGTNKGDCRFPSYRHPGEYRLIESKNILTQNTYDYMEWGYRMDGELFFGRADRSLIKMNKIANSISDNGGIQ